MKTITKLLRVFSEWGEFLGREVETLTDNEDIGNREITVTKTSVMTVCQSCGRQVQATERYSRCPTGTCQGPCCNVCHSERLKVFDRAIAADLKQLELVNSEMFNGFPLIDQIRKIYGIKMLKKLEESKKLLKGK